MTTPNGFLVDKNGGLYPRAGVSVAPDGTPTMITTDSFGQPVVTQISGGAGVTPAQIAAGAANAIGVDASGLEYSGSAAILSSRVKLASKGSQSGRIAADAVVTSGSNQVSSASLAFSSSDQGMLFTLSDPNLTPAARNTLTGIITSVQSGNVATMSVTAGFSATGCGMAVGPDNAVAIAAALSSLSVSSGSPVLQIPRGVFLTSQAFQTTDGQSICGDGPGSDYGLVTAPIGAGSSILLAATLGGSSTFFTLGNSGTGFTYGTTRSVMEGVGIDAANNADYAVKTLTRRAQVQYNQIWRGRVETLRVLAQNSEYLKNIVGAQNVGNVMGIYGLLGAADVKVLGGELRQGGATAFNATLGHQLYLENPADVLIQNVHMYSGFSSAVQSSSQGANIMIRKTDGSPGGGVVINSNILDGTYGPPVHIRNEGASRLAELLVQSNYIFTVAGALDARWGAVEVAPVSGSIRGLVVQGNAAIHNVGGRSFAAMVSQQNIDGTQTGLGGTITHTVVRNNTGISCPLSFKNFRPDSFGGNTMNVVGTTLSPMDDNQGSATFSGTGAQTAFVIPHGLVSAPTTINITAGTAAAAVTCFATGDATNITVTFTTAPASGTNNIVLNWSAKV